MRVGLPRDQGAEAVVRGARPVSDKFGAVIQVGHTWIAVKAVKRPRRYPGR